MKLCVGATSRRVVEEAARLQVHQIVASRSQVEGVRGYSGFTPDSLVITVKELSGGETDVVRDHGGPLMGGRGDYLESLHADVAAGFDGLHVDVCKVHYEEQIAELTRALNDLAGAPVYVEVGGEHEPNDWNHCLLEAALKEGITPKYVVAGFGSYVWMDRQCGRPVTVTHLENITHINAGLGVMTKIHNADWIGKRIETYGNVVDAYNIAPELGCLEVDLLLSQLNSNAVHDLLTYAYESKKWTRWFTLDQGTYFDRAKCALRYLLDDDYVMDISRTFMPEDGEQFIRDNIRRHILKG